MADFQLHLTISKEEREELERVAANFGFSLSAMARILMFGAIRSRSRILEPLIENGERQLRQMKEPVRLGGQVTTGPARGWDHDWKLIAKRLKKVYIEDPKWVLACPEKRTKYRSENQKYWWYLYHENHPRIQIPMDFDSKRAQKEALVWIRTGKAQEFIESQL